MHGQNHIKKVLRVYFLVTMFTPRLEFVLSV